MDNTTDLIMGIGPEVQLSSTVKKTLRVGTIKQIRDVGELYRDKLLRIKYAINREQPDEAEVQVQKWVDILNMVLIEGFTREEFDDCIPEQMEAVVDRFLFD